METGIQGIIDLREGAKSDVADLTGQVHQLPSSIKFDGPSSVSQYFKPKPAGIETEGLMVEEAYFRGRKLQGTTVSLPEGYCGFVLGKKSNGKRISSDMSEENSNCWKVNATFENIMYWNHDSLPSQNDTFLRSLHWLTVAKALHNPVTAEDLSSTSIALKRLD